MRCMALIDIDEGALARSFAARTSDRGTEQLARLAFSRLAGDGIELVGLEGCGEDRGDAAGSPREQGGL